MLNDLDTTRTAELKALKPAHRVELWAKWQEFIRPKLSGTALVSGEGTGKALLTEAREVSGYHDANGDFVKAPPLRHDERDVDDEQAEHPR